MQFSLVVVRDSYETERRSPEIVENSFVTREQRSTGEGARETVSSGLESKFAAKPRLISHYVMRFEESVSSGETRKLKFFWRIANFQISSNSRFRVSQVREELIWDKFLSFLIYLHGSVNLIY